jgi:hypothetical protein
MDAVRRKDYLALCRHFLWLINRQNNQPLTQKSLVSTIADLTKNCGIDKRRIENVLTEMSKRGEIERYKGISNRVAWNPKITNQVRWSAFESKYGGKPLQEDYSDHEKELIRSLEKLSNVGTFLPRDMEDYQHTKNLKEDDQEMMLNLALQKIENLEQQTLEMKSLITEVLMELKKYDPIKVDTMERHLKLVKNDD